MPISRIVTGGMITLLIGAFLLMPFASAAPDAADKTATPFVVQNAYVTYGSNDRLTLQVQEKEGWFRVVDRDGHVWCSTPEGYKEDELAQGTAKMAMASLLHIRYADTFGNLTTVNSKVACVNKNGLTMSPISNGIRMEFSFEREEFVIPLEIRLREDGVELSVDTENIQEKGSKYRLTDVAVAPYFGAANSTAQGYIMVPDGSGALMELNCTTGYTEDYSQYVYGRDSATTQLEAADQTQTVRMPVFGIKTGESGFAAILTSGEARARIQASVRGKRCSYSNIYAEFIYRESDMVLVEKKNQTVRIFETVPTAIPRQTVRYTLLSGTDASYMGMAKTYRHYLLTEKQLPIRAEAGKTPLVIELLGGVMAQESIWGFPVKRVMPLTTYADASAILTELTNKGVDEWMVDYRFWNKGGTGAAVQTKLQSESRLGGKRGLDALMKQCRTQKAALYLQGNVTDLYKSAWGYHKKWDSAVSVQKNPAMQYTYRLQDGKANVTTPSFLLTPNKVLEASRKLAQSVGNAEIAGLSTHSLGEKLYSDFGSRAISRDAAQELWQQSLAALGKAGGVLVSGGNAYALPYASVITDAPMTSSAFLSQTVAIPFYQLVLHGILPISTPSLNGLSNPRQGVLFALETGSTLKYQWLARNYEALKETDYNSIISALYTDWIDGAVANYVEVKSVLAAVANQTIVQHEQLMPQVRRTTFADGTVVTVNYRAESVMVDGAEIAAEQFRAEMGESQ